MIVNLYIEIKRNGLVSEFERLCKLEAMLEHLDMQFYNATDYDTCTSGLNSLSTIEEIKEAIECSDKEI